MHCAAINCNLGHHFRASLCIRQSIIGDAAVGLVDLSLKKVALNVICEVSFSKWEEANSRSIEIDWSVFVYGHLYISKGEFRANAGLV
jgi:hypothetical protein